MEPFPQQAHRDPDPPGGVDEAVESDLFARIRLASPRLSPAKLAAAEYIITRVEDVAFWPAARLAEAVGVSESVVVRLAVDLGYAGYPDLQRAAQEVLRRRLYLPGQALPPGGTEATSPAGETVDRSFRSQRRILEVCRAANPPQALEQAAQLLLEARRSVAVGFRMGYILAEAAAFNLQLLLGNAAVATLGPDTLEDTLSGYGPGDAALLFDFRPYNPAMDRVVEILTQQRTRRIAVTDSHSAPAARGAHVVLRTPTEMDAGAGRSLVGGMALLDALGALVWELDPNRCRASMRQIMALRMGSMRSRPGRRSGAPGRKSETRKEGDKR
ncbi:MAG: MurR/RpiR family transcriptional regulator [Thermaerobacter sp.]